MSSPFDTFRTHRTYWMAGTVLLAILAFIVAPAITSFMELEKNGGGAGNEVVVRWSDGKVTFGTLETVRLQHNRTTRFLQALAREVIKSGGMPKVPGFRYDPASKRVQDLGLPVLDTNRAVCQTMIISQRAKQLGIDFDKAVIDDFFVRFCDNKVTSEQFASILKENAGRELSQQGLYRQLSLELSAVVMERIALAGVNYEGSPLVTPGSLWQNYLRLNQAARVEAYPVLTGDFVKLVKDKPSESDIRTTYDAGVNNFPSPNSPDPGFRRRYQANIEYVFGSWNKMIEVEKAKISPEALKAEYDRLVALGGLQVPVDPPKLPETPTAPVTVPATPEGSQPAAPAAPAATKPEEGQPPAPAAATEKPAEPAVEPKAEEPKPVEPAAPAPETKPAEEKPAEEKPAEEKPAADPKSQSSLTSAGNVRLVAFQQEADKQPPPVADPGATPETPAATPPAAEAPAVPSTTPPATAATDAPAAATDAAAAAPPVQPATATPTISDAGAAGDKPGTTPMRTQTFEEAKDALARNLAMNVVRDQLQTKIDRINTEMNRYFSELETARINEQNKVKNEKPVTPIDLKKLAESEGLQFGSTGVSDGFRLATTPVGRSSVNSPGSMMGNVSLVNMIMNPNYELYRPTQSMFIDMGNSTEPDFQQFVSWKTEEVQAYTPALTDIREEVIDAWKVKRARDLARDDAEALAEKLRKAGPEGFKTVLDAQQQTLLINPTPFTWMSPPSEMFAPAQVTFVQGLDSVGNDFMQRVFSSPTGQVAVAPNSGLTTYYVVRVAELTPAMEELQQNFETSRGRARQLAFSERESLFSDWYQNIEKTLNVQWLAPADMLVN